MCFAPLMCNGVSMEGDAVLEASAGSVWFGGVTLERYFEGLVLVVTRGEPSCAVNSWLVLVLLYTHSVATTNAVRGGMSHTCT